MKVWSAPAETERLPGNLWKVKTTPWGFEFLAGVVHCWPERLGWEAPPYQGTSSTMPDAGHLRREIPLLHGARKGVK